MVYLVKDPETKNLFAFKTVNKAQVVQQSIEAHLLVFLYILFIKGIARKTRT